MARSQRLRPLLAVPLTLALLVAAEGALRARWGRPPEDPARADFLRYHYLDIYTPFFRLNRQALVGPSYESRRPRAAPQAFLARKPPGTARVFVVGGSVAIAYAQEAVHRLGEILGRALPGRTFEVISCGMGGYDSYRDSLVLGEVLHYEPDAIVLLTGNNEYYRPVKMSRFAARLDIVFGGWWLYRWPRERMGAGRSIPPIPLAERARAFEDNVRSMVRRARGAGVPVVLCALPINLRVPPITSPAPANPTYWRAWMDFQRGRSRAAVARFSELVAAAPSEPFGHYWLARALERSGRGGQAKAHYLRAADLDDPGDRCHPAVNAALRRVAREEGAALADLDAAFQRLVPDGVPDERLFEDHVHWSSSHYPLASLTIARAAAAFDRASGTAAFSRGSSWRLAALGSVTDGPAPPRRPRDAILKSISYVLVGPEPLLPLEISVALLESSARESSKPLERYASSLEAVASEFERTPWLRGHQRTLQRRWPSVLAHFAEALRRRGLNAQAWRCLKTAVRLDPLNSAARFERAFILRLNGDAAGAQAEAAAVPESVRRSPQIASWLDQVAGP